MPIIKPKVPITKLKGKLREVMLVLVRQFAEALREKSPEFRKLGGDEAEEIIIKLIDEGLLQIIHDEEKGKFYLKAYNKETDEYEYI